MSVAHFTEMLSNSLDLWEVVSDNEEKFVSVAACIQPHSPPWVSEVAWVACLNTGPLTYVGMEPGIGHLNSKEFILHALQPSPPANCVVMCKLS